jgi:hypothetical protein
MAILIAMDLSKKQVEADLKDFKQLLNDPNTPDLDEKKHILPFFRARPHLCGFMGTYNPNIVNYRRISTADEFDIFGDHIADLAVGDTANHEYCFIEFENAKATLLVIGRDKYLTNQGLRDRMNWRTDHVVIASKKFHCITFDKLYEDLALRVDILKG